VIGYRDFVPFTARSIPSRPQDVKLISVAELYFEISRQITWVPKLR